MTVEEGISLVYEKLPKETARASKYDKILDEFISSGEASARLDISKNVGLPKTLAVALRSRAKNRKLSIRVRTIRGQIWLVKLKQEV